MGLPYANSVVQEDPVIARLYEGIYRRAVPKLLGLWILGGSIAIFDYSLEVLNWQRSDWATSTGVPCLRVVAAFLIGTVAAQAIDLVFRGVGIAVQLIKFNPGMLDGKWWVSSLLVVHSLPLPAARAEIHGRTRWINLDREAVDSISKARLAHSDHGKE